MIHLSIDRPMGMRDKPYHSLPLIYLVIHSWGVNIHFYSLCQVRSTEDLPADL